MNTKIRATKSLVTGIAALALLAGCASATPKPGDPDFRGDGTDGVTSSDKNSSVSKTGGLTDGMKTVEFDFIDTASAPKGEAIRVEIPEVILKDSEVHAQTITEAYTITSVETDKLGLCAVGIDIEYRDGADMSLRDSAFVSVDDTYDRILDSDIGAVQSAIGVSYAEQFGELSIKAPKGKPAEPGVTMSPDYSSIVVADPCPESGETFDLKIRFRGFNPQAAEEDLDRHTDHASFDVTVNSDGMLWASPYIDNKGRNRAIEDYTLDSTGKWMPR